MSLSIILLVFTSIVLDILPIVLVNVLIFKYVSIALNIWPA